MQAIESSYAAQHVESGEFAKGLAQSVKDLRVEIIPDPSLSEYLLAQALAYGSIADFEEAGKAGVFSDEIIKRIRIEVFPALDTARINPGSGKESV